MVESATAQVAQANTSAARNAGSDRSDPHAAATEIMQRNTNRTGPDISEVRRDLAALAAQDAEFAAQVRTAVEARLTPVERGQLASASFTMDAPDGGGIAFSDDGMTVAERFASPAGSAERAQYDRFDRIWGDGNPATDDSAAIERGLSDMIASGLSLEQVGTAAATPAAANENTADTATLIADLTQMGIDIVGIVDPTGAADGANAIISLGRAGLALWNGKGGEALGHLGNGALSAISILPLGDLAKAGKIGKWADTVSSAIRAAADNPVVREAVTPMLREIATNLDRIPQSAIDALPAGARESIQRMKTQLDKVFGVAARQVDDAGRAIVRNADGSVNMDAAARAYADAVQTNAPWSWADNFSGTFTAGERSAIRREALSRGLIAEVPLKPGTRYADFAAAGLVSRVDTLPQDLWLRGDAAQFAWLDARIPGGRPDGFTWHHAETPGRMELVPFGEHNITSHIGGRSPGHWAHAPR